jgi:glycerophosphoryl diester phosphodiesterase
MEILKTISVIMLFCISICSCIYELPTSPELNSELIITRGRIPVPNRDVQLKMDGKYIVLDGKDLLGNTVACRWIRESWCIHADYDVVYGEFAGGFNDSSLEFNGYIRLVRSGSGSKVSLVINAEEGGRELSNGGQPAEIIIRGETTDGVKITLKRIGDLSNEASAYGVLAHRGGGRNAERLGYSENSIEMILHSEIMGATGVEIDIKRTKDGKIILFHDDTFSPRTVKGAYLLGKVENFDLKQIKVFGKLIYGETIPTLSEALNAIIDETNLNTVWLDTKDPESVDEAIRIQSEAIIYAGTKGRQVKILLGIPSQEVLNAYNASSGRNTTPILIELSPDIVLSSSYPTCEAWGPKWTIGISESNITSVRSLGKKVFVWTIDMRDFISDFLKDGKADGILSNYPSLVSGMNYLRE